MEVRMKRMLICLLSFLATLSLGGVVQASNIQFIGNVGWTINGTSIDIRADEVNNADFSGVSGTIRLQIWATAFPYAGGTISGYVLGTRTLGQLTAGYSYFGVSGNVSYSSPSAGTYYTTITVEEYTVSGYVIRDWVTFSGTSVLGSGGGGGSGSLSIVGNVSWSINGTKIDISSDEVLNNQLGGVSGTLRLRIWATTLPYSGGTINGYVLGTRSLGTLSGGYQISNISGYVPYTPPPDGLYYTTMTLEEYTGSGYVIVDYVNFPASQYFSTGGSGGVDSGGGGGGALDGIGLYGKLKYKLSAKKGTAQFQLGEIYNARSSGLSGLLRVRLWASNSYYAGGTLTGYPIAERDMGQLAGGYFYDNLSFTTSYSPPPGGAYYLVLTVDEYSNGEWLIQDFYTFPKPKKFKGLSALSKAKMRTGFDGTGSLPTTPVRR